MRLFVAINLPETVQTKYKEVYEKLEEIKGIKPVSPKNMHLTLLFLNNYEPEHVSKKLKKITPRKIRIDMEGFGFYPNAKTPRVIWLRIKPSKELIDMQKEIREAFGIKLSFDPHLTIGRIKKITKDDFKELIDFLTKIKKQSFETDSFKLIQSQLTNLGSVYTVLETFEAGKNL